MQSGWPKPTWNLTDQQKRDLFKRIRPILFVVYEARDSDGVVVYVGRSALLVRRLAEHHRLSDWVEEVDVIKLHRCVSEAHMVALERAMIRKFQPEFNETERRPLEEEDHRTLALHEDYVRTGNPPAEYPPSFDFRL